MQKKSLTNKITNCCTLPFSVMKFIVDNLTLSSEADRTFLISKLHQNGTLSIDAWKVWINSGTLETDAALTKAEFLAWFDCDRQPSCSQLKLLIEGYKLGNYNPIDEYGVGWTEQNNFEEYGEKIIKKVTGYVGGVGSIPAELQANIGKYYAVNGGFTTNKDLATDFKPEVGSAKTIFNPTDNVNPSTMKAASDRWDKTLVALKSLVNPVGDGPWETMVFPSGENQGFILNQNGVGEVQPNGAYGDIYATNLSGVSSLRITAPGMDQFGTTISWWMGYRADNTFDVLKSGIIVNGVAQINTDPQYTRYKYSRPKNGAVLEKTSKVALPVEEDAVIKAIENKGAGYSGVLDLTTLGVKTTNTAVQNTDIINAAIEAESLKFNPRTLKLPGGTFKVNEVIHKPGIELSGASNLSTVLATDVGSTARFIIMLPDGLIKRAYINNLVIDARNTTEGGVYINNTFDFQMHNCAVLANAISGIKLKGCLYHKIADIYFDGGDIGLQVINAQDTSSTAMATNLIKYDRLYFVKSKKKCVELNAGSNYVFNSCNFEDSGISGDDTTGGVHAIGLSPGGEGVDVAFNNCWSEGIRGGYIYKFDNCKGNSVIRDCMMGKGGNGTGTISNAIINVGSRLLLSGATRFSTAPHFNPFPTNIRTEGGGTTLVDNPNINTGINNVGTFKIAQYS